MPSLFLSFIFTPSNHFSDDFTNGLCFTQLVKEARSMLHLIYMCARIIGTGANACLFDGRIVVTGAIACLFGANSWKTSSCISVLCLSFLKTIS